MTDPVIHGHRCQYEQRQLVRDPCAAMCGQLGSETPDSTAGVSLGMTRLRHSCTFRHAESPRVTCKCSNDAKL